MTFRDKLSPSGESGAHAPKGVHFPRVARKKPNNLTPLAEPF